MSENYFVKLSGIDLKEYIEQVEGSGGKMFDYVGWSFAWSELKKIYPNANYNVLKNSENGCPCFLQPNAGYFVAVEVTIDGLAHTEWAAVVDAAHRAMKDVVYKSAPNRDGKTFDIQAADSTDIQSAQKRCFVKAIAMHGLGISIFMKKKKNAPDKAFKYRTIGRTFECKDQLKADGWINKNFGTKEKEDWGAVKSFDKELSPEEIDALGSFGLKVKLI